MNRYVNPSLLQLTALGIEDDHYLQDGHHLRWAFSPDLGFPRSGFRLVRRPSPLPWNPKRQDVRVRRASLSGSHISDSVIRHEEGIHVSAENGLKAGSGGSRISVGSDTLRIRFTEDEIPDTASTPACWVMLRYRHRKTGSIAASAVFVDDETVRVQDRGASGRNIRGLLDRLANGIDLDPDKIRRFRDVAYLPTFTDAQLEDTELERRLERTAPERERDLNLDSDSDLDRDRRFTHRFGRSSSGRLFGNRPRINVDPILRGGRFRRRWRPGFGSDEWVQGTFLLNGSVIDELHVTGSRAEVELIEWITVDDYADAEGWKPVETFFLPIDGDDVTYPAQPTPGSEVARERLEHAPPKALGPWANEDWPPAPASEGAITDEQTRRYLDGYDELADALETLVATELEEAVPQRAVRYGGSEPLQATAGTNEDLSGSTIDLPLLEMLQVASIDPGFARVLGLATTDFDADSEQSDRVDYMVSADWWTLWVWGVLVPGMRDRVLDIFQERKPNDAGIRLPLPGTSHGGGRHARMPNSQVATAISVATGISVAPRDDVASPKGVDTTVETRTGVSDVPAVVRVSWDVPDANLFTGDGHVSFAVRRRHEGTDESLVRTDPESDLPLARLPGVTGTTTFTDRTPMLGSSTYRVSGMDIWGRWSDFTETQANVTDTVPPPSPTGLRARLLGDDDDSPIWTLELSFNWTGGQQTLAPDTSRFEIHCEQGKVDRSFAGWGGIETRAGVHSPLSISWTDLGVSTPLSDVTVSVDPVDATSDPAADARITVTVPDVHVPFRASQEHRALASVTVVAVDDHDNRSPPARRAVAERVDPVEPSTEPLTLEPQVATWPDATGNCYWTTEWNRQPVGSRTQVLRAPQARLLAAADESLETFENRDITGRIQRLREIATNHHHQHAFSPDHEEPYDDGETRHQVALPAEDRGLTVVTVRHTGPSGTRGAWPTTDECFAVVRTPETARPPTPALTARTDMDAPGEIQLVVAPDRSGSTETVRLYRTPDSDVVADIRRMRPLTPVPSSTSDPIERPDAVPPDRWYAYRAVAVGESGLRSSPTQPLWMRADTNAPPPEPVIESVTRPSPGRSREVTVRVTGYELDLRLARRPVGMRSWTTLDRTSAQDLGFQALGSSTQTLTVRTEVPTSASDSRYEYYVEVIDRRGRTATSNVVTES